jgi:hypothetical protein
MNTFQVVNYIGHNMDPYWLTNYCAVKVLFYNLRLFTLISCNTTSDVFVEWVLGISTRHIAPFSSSINVQSDVSLYYTKY